MQHGNLGKVGDLRSAAGGSSLELGTDQMLRLPFTLRPRMLHFPMSGSRPTFYERDQLERARAALAAHDPLAADRLAEEVLRSHRSSVEALEIRAAAAFQSARHEAARTMLQRCIGLKPKEARFHARMAEVLAAEGRYEEALAALDRMHRACSARVPTAQIAKLHRLRGDRPAARNLLEPEVRGGRGGAPALLELAAIDLADGDAAAAEQGGCVAASTGDEAVARQAWFLVGAARERLGDCDGAMDAWTKANACASVPFDRAGFDARRQRILDVFGGDRIRDLSRGADSSGRPALIVGLPRSGTSLVEQMLACHLAIAGGGELPDLTRLSRELSGEDGVGFPEAAALLDERTATKLAREYLDRLRRIGRRASVVTNKNLDLAELLGFAWQLLPGARAIVLERDLRDTGLSCFASDLQSGSHPWASCLPDIAHAFQAHRQLLEHWAQTIDIPTLVVSYERLVTEPEEETRRMLDFLGLPFDDACLRHHESSRVAATLSIEQVRKPLYGSSVGRWRRFEAGLEPMLAGLSSAGLLDES